MLDNEKDQTLQEITETARLTQAEVTNRKKSLAPSIKELRELTEETTQLDQEYNEKKKEYDSVVLQLDTEKEKMGKEVKSTFNDYRKDEKQFHQNNIQTEIYDAFLKRIGNEAKFINQPEERLTNEFKSYTDFFNAKLKQQDSIVKDLKAHQKHIKDNY